MSYLIRTGNGRTNISWSTTANSSTKYLRRTGTGRTNIVWTTIPQGSTYNILNRNGTGRNNILWANLKIANPGEPQYSTDISSACTITKTGTKYSTIILQLLLPCGVFMYADINVNNGNMTVDGRSCNIQPGSYSSSSSRYKYLGIETGNESTGNFTAIFNEAKKLTVRNSWDGKYMTVKLSNGTHNSSYNDLEWSITDRASETTTTFVSNIADVQAMKNYFRNNENATYVYWFNKVW